MRQIQKMGQYYEDASFYAICLVILKLIVMLINRLSKFMRVIRTSKFTKNHPLVSQQLPFSKWEKEDILNQLQSDIIEAAAKTVPEHQANLDYFTKNHWKIEYDEAQQLYVYAKTDEDYEIRVLTRIKNNPPNEVSDETDKKPLQQVKSKPLNYSEANVFIKKQGSDKWLAAQMGVFEGLVEVVSIFFTFSQPTLKKLPAEYHGPQLSTLPQQVRSVLSDILMDVGLSSQMIMNMVVNSSSQVDKLDVQWLRDIKELWV